MYYMNCHRQTTLKPNKSQEPSETKAKSQVGRKTKTTKICTYIYIYIYTYPPKSPQWRYRHRDVNIHFWLNPHCCSRNPHFRSLNQGLVMLYSMSHIHVLFYVRFRYQQWPSPGTTITCFGIRGITAAWRVVLQSHLSATWLFENSRV